jgi:hypothetical protein
VKALVKVHINKEREPPIEEDGFGFCLWKWENAWLTRLIIKNG